MRTMGPGELRLLGRLVIDPSRRQINFAKDLQVTRSAVNQIWQNLELEYELKIRGNLDYGKVGLKMVFGWAIANDESDILEKFHRWLRSSKLVTSAIKSAISSTFDSRVYFEAILPLGSQYDWFQSQINRFRKKPYSLTIHTSNCLKISHHMNMGLFDGVKWKFPEIFRLEASIGAARSFVDILPSVETVEQSSPGSPNIDDLVAAAVIESDYNATATRLASLYSELSLKADSGRTLRRRIAEARRKFARPYIEITNLGLNQHMMICIRDDPKVESPFSRLLHAQGGTFPKARVISGTGLTLLELFVPDSIKWLGISQVMSSLAGDVSDICTFIADRQKKETRFESVVSYLASRTPSG